MRDPRYLALVGAAISLLTPANAVAQAALDVPVRGQARVAAPDPARPCNLWRTAEEIARFVGVRVGFENTPDCAPGGHERRAYGPAIDLRGMTPRAVFDQIVQARPEFAWRPIDNVIVLRPKAAWHDPANVLHRPVARFTVAKLHPHLVLHEVLLAAQPSLFIAHEHAQLSALGRRIDDPAATGLIDVPISVRFTGGTLLQALNAVAKPFGGNWDLSYWGRPHVELFTPDFDEGSTGITMAAATAPPGRR